MDVLGWVQIAVDAILFIGLILHTHVISWRRRRW